MGFDPRHEICWTCYGAEVLEGGKSCPVCQSRRDCEFSEEGRIGSWVHLVTFCISLISIVMIARAIRG